MLKCEGEKACLRIKEIWKFAKGLTSSKCYIMSSLGSPTSRSANKSEPMAKKPTDLPLALLPPWINHRVQTEGYCWLSIRFFQQRRVG